MGNAKPSLGKAQRHGDTIFSPTVNADSDCECSNCHHSFLPLDVKGLNSPTLTTEFRF